VSHRQAPITKQYRTREDGSDHPARLAHSQAPIPANTANTTAMAGVGSNRRPASSGGIRQPAVMRRCLSMLCGLELVAGAPETALARGKGVQCVLELGGAEIRPHALGEVQLGIGQLPQ